MTWDQVATHLVSRLAWYMATRQRGVSRLRFSLDAVMELHQPNYVPSDQDWRALESELRARGYALVRPDATSVAIFDVSTFKKWTQIAVDGPIHLDGSIDTDL